MRACSRRRVAVVALLPTLASWASGQPYVAEVVGGRPHVVGTQAPFAFNSDVAVAEAGGGPDGEAVEVEVVGGPDADGAAAEVVGAAASVEDVEFEAVRGSDADVAVADGGVTVEEMEVQASIVLDGNETVAALAVGATVEEVEVQAVVGADGDFAITGVATVQDVDVQAIVGADGDASGAEVVSDRDASGAEVVSDGDAAAAEVVSDGDAAAAEVVSDRDASGAEVVSDRDAAAAEVVSDRDAAAAEVVSDRDAAAAEVVSDRDASGAEVVSDGDAAAAEVVSDRDAAAAELVSDGDASGAELVSDGDAAAAEAVSDRDAAAAEVVSNGDAAAAEVVRGTAFDEVGVQASTNSNDDVAVAVVDQIDETSQGAAPHALESTSSSSSPGAALTDRALDPETQTHNDELDAQSPLTLTDSSADENAPLASVDPSTAARAEYLPRDSTAANRSASEIAGPGDTKGLGPPPAADTEALSKAGDTQAENTTTSSQNDHDDETPAHADLPPAPANQICAQLDPMGLRAALLDFYKHKAPEKVEQLDHFLTRYKGREQVLFENLQTKYGEMPAFSLTGCAETNPTPGNQSLPGITEEVSKWWIAVQGYVASALAAATVLWTKLLDLALVRKVVDTGLAAWSFSASKAAGMDTWQLVVFGLVAFVVAMLGLLLCWVGISCCCCPGRIKKKPEIPKLAATGVDEVETAQAIAELEELRRKNAALEAEVHASAIAVDVLQSQKVR